MRAAVWKGAGKSLEIEEVAAPEPGPGELLLKVQACGICGSDLHMSDSPGLPVGMVMGHEFSGEVVEVRGDARSAEGHAFRRDEMNSMLDLAASGIGQLLQMQSDARS